MKKNNLEKMYSDKRNKTLSLIQDAIDELQEDGKIVTKKDLMTLTGLSSGTFSLPHVKELLERNKVCQYRTTISIKEQHAEKNKDEIINMLNKENERLKIKVTNLENQQEVFIKENATLKVEKDSYLLLRGKYQELLEAYYSLGGDISRFDAE